MGESAEAKYVIPARYRRMENMHIVFWLLKDISWCMIWKELGLAMFLPTLTIAIVIAWRTWFTYPPIAAPRGPSSSRLSAPSSSPSRLGGGSFGDGGLGPGVRAAATSPLEASVVRASATSVALAAAGAEGALPGDELRRGIGNDGLCASASGSCAIARPA